MLLFGTYSVNKLVSALQGQFSYMVSKDPDGKVHSIKLDLFGLDFAFSDLDSQPTLIISRIIFDSNKQYNRLMPFIKIRGEKLGK